MKKTIILLSIIFTCSLSYGADVYEKVDDSLKTTTTKEVVEVSTETMNELETEKARLEEYIAQNLITFNAKDTEYKEKLAEVNKKIMEAEKLGLSVLSVVKE